MSIPTKPYATSAQVAMLLPNLMNGAVDFSDSTGNDATAVRKASVDQYLVWISNELDLQFQQAGYVLPFQELSDESWPEHQTHYLELVTALGAAALTGGHVLKPAPALSTGRGNSSGNIYQDMYNTELRKIWDTVHSYVRFRARAYAGTPAQISITEPQGPYLDYQAAMMNPEDFLLFWDYTTLRKNISDYVSLNFDGVPPLDWTDFHGLVSNKMSGYSYVAPSS